MNHSPNDHQSTLAPFAGEPAPKLHDRVVGVLHPCHYSRRTEQAYMHWIRRFIRSHGRLQDGYDIRTVQELVRQKHIKTAIGAFSLPTGKGPYVGRHYNSQTHNRLAPLMNDRQTILRFLRSEGSRRALSSRHTLGVG